MSLKGLNTTQPMWAHHHHIYEIRNKTLYIDAVTENQSLSQLDSTVDEFHCQMSIVWQRLDNLGAEFCPAGTCRCCDHQRS